jgi:hypothetical protein
MKLAFRAAALMSGIWLAAVCASNAHFSFLEDEITQLTDAARPLSDTAGNFWFGRGMHEHPPLSDFLLHFWLPIAGHSLVAMRLLSAFFFVAGLVLFGLAARKLAGDTAFLPVIALGLLSPYNFHFARLAGWYSCCFLLVGWLTLAWLRYRESPTNARLAGFIAPAILLTYGNYFGWAIVLLMLLNGFVWKTAAIVIGAMAVAYIPLWNAFLSEIRFNARPSGLVSNMLLGGFNFYTLLVSESVAPWFWYLSVPAMAAAATGIVLALRQMTARQRQFFWYFCVAFAGLALTGKADTKRSFFLSGWLLMALGCALARRNRALVLCLGLIAAIGWTGIATRQWYSAPHFIEPWGEVADRAAASIRQGDLVLSNSPAFLFYLGRSSDPHVFTIRRWQKTAPAEPFTVLLVNGVNQGLIRDTAAIEVKLGSGCTRLESQRLVPDSGSELKQRLFPQFREPPFRILVERYRCA